MAASFVFAVVIYIQYLTLLQRTWNTEFDVWDPKLAVCIEACSHLQSGFFFIFVNVNVVLHFPASMHNLQPAIAQDKHNSVDLDSQLQEQERIITISYALASEASQRSKEVAGNT